MKKIILGLLFLLIISSCGIRKVNRQKIKEETNTEKKLEETKKETKETKKETNTEKVTEKTDNFDKVDESESLEPINPDKPMKKTESEKDGVKTTTYENAKVVKDKKTDKSKKEEKIIDKDIKNNKKYNGSELRNKIYNHLISQGYSKEKVINIINTYGRQINFY